MSFCGNLKQETGLRKWIIQVTNSAHRVNECLMLSGPKREPAQGRLESALRRSSRRGGKAILGRPATGNQLLKPAPAGYEKLPNRFILSALGVDREKYYGFGVTVALTVGGATQREPGLMAGKVPVIDHIKKQAVCHKTNMVIIFDKKDRSHFEQALEITVLIDQGTIIALLFFL